jgi:hypothetical protein
MHSCRGRALCRRWACAAGVVVLGLASLAQAEPVAFRGTVVTDIRLGAQNYHNAALKLTFLGDTADIAAVTDSSGKPIPSSCQNTIPKGMYNGISEGLADVAAIPADSVYVSDAVLALPTNLTQTTLLSRRAHTCAVAYTIVPPAVPNQTSFVLDKCPSPAPRGLVTSKGPFFLQDQFGVNFGTQENTGTLEVEVLADDTDEGDD